MSRLLMLISVIAALVSACSGKSVKEQNITREQQTIISTNPEGKGAEISIELYRGKSFYYPLMAAWIEDEAGNFIQTLYVPVTIATGVFKYGRKENNNWVQAPKRAPQTLPYWSHKRGVIASDGLYMPEPENPVPDAYTGATPVKGFVLNTRTDKELPPVYRILFEINQNWDWNEYWTNNKFPDDEDYKMSCQPALVYEAVIDNGKNLRSVAMQPIGHSHYSGKTGELFPDLSTLTTALYIADSIIVRVR